MDELLFDDDVIVVVVAKFELVLVINEEDLQDESLV